MIGLLTLPIIGVIVVFVIFLLSTYTVVKPNQAHVVVRFGRGKKVYSPKLTERDDESGQPEQAHKTAYFFVPFVMKRQILDLTNVKMMIDNIELHDKEVAPFNCDVVCWFHVNDPAKAVERLDLDHDAGVFGSVKDSLGNLIQAVAREVAMKQEVLEIMRDRNTFGQQVELSVEKEIEKWGVQVVDLEINDIRDSDGSDIIESYESIRQVQVATGARKLNAERIREAVEVEQDNKQKAEMKVAEVEETYRKRQIEKERTIGIAEADQAKQIAEKTKEANETTVEAEKSLELGRANIVKQATITKAEGEAESIRVKGEKAADVVKLTGTAEADVVKAKGFAEAEAKQKMADALKAFNESGISLEQLRAFVSIQIAKYENMALMFQNANINLASSDPQKIFGGFNLDVEGGAAMGGFIKQLESMTGKGIGELIKEAKDGVMGSGEPATGKKVK